MQKSGHTAPSKCKKLVQRVSPDPAEDNKESWDHDLDSKWSSCLKELTRVLSYAMGFLLNKFSACECAITRH